jgi:hypothetical protein
VLRGDIPQSLAWDSRQNRPRASDDKPLLFHTGLRQLLPTVREAIERVMPVERLRYVAVSHGEKLLLALGDALGK